MDPIPSLQPTDEDTPRVDFSVPVERWNSPDPIAWLNVPSCETERVNPAHSEAFPQCDGYRVPTKGDCYCKVAGAPIALDSKYCTFTSAYNELRLARKNTRFNVKKHIGFVESGGNRASSGDSPGVRFYRVVYILSKLLKGPFPRSGKPDFFLMESRIIPLGDLVVIISGNAQKEEAPKHLSAVIRSGCVDLWTGEFEISADPEYKAYLQFYGILCESEKRLLAREKDRSADKVWAMQEFENMRRSFRDSDYEPVEDYLPQVFDQHDGEETIRNDRARLFDVLVVVRELRDKIEDMLTRGLAEIWSKLSDITKVQILRSMKTPQDLQASDSFVFQLNRISEDHNAEETSELDRQFDTYLEKLPDLIRRCPGEFVALANRDVICSGKTESELLEELAKRGNEAVTLIQKVPSLAV